jgi:processive 1,2-diacylglycerol beta-glucosyltransferase
VRAAEAIEAALRMLSPRAEVANDDVLSLMPKAFTKLYRDAYLEMVGRAPKVLGWIYDATDKPFHKDPIRLKIEQAGAARLLEKIRRFNPDVVICTHFLPTALLDRERRKHRSHARIVTVVTDFEVHGFWLGAPSDRYCVANAEARAHLEAIGIAPAAIAVTGIPTHPAFAKPKDRAAMRRKHGLRPDLPVLLMSAGGFGAGNAGRVVRQLVDSGVQAQIVAACGKSAALKTSIEKIGSPLVRAIGYTTEMDELMSAADSMLGKPGGLTTAESLVKGLAWVIVNPIPGQEERNAIHLLEEGAGVWCNNLHTLGFKVRSLLEEPGRLEAMRARALRLARPQAAEDVARLAAAYAEV